MNFILWVFRNFFTYNQRISVIRDLCKRKCAALNIFSDVASFERYHKSFGRKKEKLSYCCSIIHIASYFVSFDSRVFLSSLLCSFIELSTHFFCTVALLFLSASLFASNRKKRKIEKVQTRLGGIYLRSVLCHQGLNSAWKS